jgi:hypothetical protein
LELFGTGIRVSTVDPEPAHINNELVFKPADQAAVGKVYRRADK